MAKIEIDKNGQVNGLPPDEIEKNGCLTEMSANKTVCLLSEKCDKGYVTRIMTMDGDCGLVGKASRSLITDMTSRNFWPSRWEVDAYYSLYGDTKRRLNKAEIGPGVAFYPVTDSQRNTSWINVAVITGVTGTARGTVIETSADFDLHVAKNVDSIRAELMAIRVISHWMCQAYNANRLVNEHRLLSWIHWPTYAPFDVDVSELERRKVQKMLGHLAMHVVVETKHRKSLAKISEYLQKQKNCNYRRTKANWIDDILNYD